MIIKEQLDPALAATGQTFTGIILHAGFQNGNICIWLDNDNGRFVNEIIVVPTGGTPPKKTHSYLQTVINHDQTLVFHLYSTWKYTPR